MSEYIATVEDGAFIRCDFAQEIVRCMDCRYAYPIFDEDGNEERDWLDCHGKLVELWDYYNDDFKDNPVPPDGFCAWAERKDDDSSR